MKKAPTANKIYHRITPNELFRSFYIIASYPWRQKNQNNINLMSYWSNLSHFWVISWWIWYQIKTFWLFCSSRVSQSRDYASRWNECTATTTNNMLNYAEIPRRCGREWKNDERTVALKTVFVFAFRRRELILRSLFGLYLSYIYYKNAAG